MACSEKDTGLSTCVTEEIGELAKRCGVEKVVLFGSRARGDYKRASDIDLAAEGGDVDLFRLLVEEETSTLLQYDVVNLNWNTNTELAEIIKNEGVTLYESKNISEKYPDLLDKTEING
ncbi:nucleotidyltransferase domain-containing protein [bacterium]|nr:nucleotidyltransferase domain-containing protein [bacterium]